MASIKKELFAGVFFTALGKYSYVVVSILITAVLARILTPSDFGVVAIATVLINFFSMLSDMGIGPAIIQNKRLTEDDLQSIFSLTLYIGVVLSGLFFLTAPLFSAYYSNEKLTTVIQLLSIVIFFHCADIVPRNLIIKDKRFSFLAYVNIGNQIVCGIIAIITAYFGLGLYSLIVQPILSSFNIFIIDKSQNKLTPCLYVKWKAIKKILSYSSYQFLFSFINYFSRNLDKLVVGRVFGVSDLGFYEKSYRLMMLPVGNLTHIVTPAIQPIFSEFQDNKELLYRRSIRLFKVFALMGFPISVFLFFCSKEIILIAFGSQWYGAIPVFQILSLSVGFQMIYSPQGAFFQSANAVKEMFYCGIVTASLNVISVVLGCLVFRSIIILSWLIVVTYILAFIVTYTVMIKRVFNKSFLYFIKEIIFSVIISCLIAIALYFANILLCSFHYVVSFTLKALLFITILLFIEFRTKTFRQILK